MADTNDNARLQVRRMSIKECVRATVDLAATCDPAAFAELPVEVSSTTPARLQRVRELAQRLRLMPDPGVP